MQWLKRGRGSGRTNSVSNDQLRQELYSASVQLRRYAIDCNMTVTRLNSFLVCAGNIQGNMRELNITSYILDEDNRSYLQLDDSGLRVYQHTPGCFK